MPAVRVGDGAFPLARLFRAPGERTALPVWLPQKGARRSLPRPFPCDAGHTAWLSAAGLSHPAGMFPPRDTLAHTMRPLCTVGDLSVPAGGLAFITIVMVITTARSAEGWRLISIQSQALPRWLNRPARLRRLRAPRGLRSLPALTADSPALFGQELGPNTAAEFGWAGQGRIPRRKGRQGFPSHLLLGRWPQGGCGPGHGPSGPSALPGHAKEPLLLALCGLVATLWWGKAWEAKLCQLSHPHLRQSRLGREATPGMHFGWGRGQTGLEDAESTS